MAEGRVLVVVNNRSSSSKSPSRRPNYRRPVTIKESVQDEWICAFCEGLLILAFQTDCGCRFCEVCLDELAESGAVRRCPVLAGRNCGPFSRKTGEYHLQPKPDKAVNRLIASVRIHCPNQCKTKNLVAGDLQFHLEHHCLYYYCHHCKVTVERKSMQSHTRSENCKDCSISIPSCLFKSHREDPSSDNFCPKFSGLCPYCKLEVIEASTLRLHRIICSEWQQKCNYEVLGCNGDHAKDTEEELLVHLPYTLREILGSFPPQTTPSDMYNIKELSHENQKRSDEAVKYLENIEKTIKEDGEFQKRLDNAVEQVKEQHKQTEELHKLLKNATTLSLHSYQPTEFPVAPYIWRIKNYLDLKKHEQVLDSRPFLSHQYGYKMRVRLYLNGDGQGRGTHLSAYVILMAYDYDNLQSWPFRYPFLFTLLDQTQKGQDYQQLIHPNPKSRSFQRPARTEAENVRASGCAKFFPLERLQQSCIYLQDGTLYVKIDVLYQTGT